MAAVVSYVGLTIITNLVSGLGGTVPKYLACGTGSGTSARTDTTLFTEAYSTAVSGSDNIRPTCTLSRTTTTETNDTFTAVGTFTASITTAVTNMGLFDSNGIAANNTTPPSGGNLFCKSDFAAGPVGLSPGDTLTLTANVQWT